MTYDLRPWAQAGRYRYRYEQSYRFETDATVKGDGRDYVEVLCMYGTIYPYGGETLLAYANRGVKRHLAGLAGVSHHQTDGDAEVFKFPVERLDAVAAILKPRRKRASGASPEQLRVMRDRKKSLAQIGQDAQKTTNWQFLVGQATQP